jgi:glycosyltransferase involved in cell wall biosynthesis
MRYGGPAMNCLRHSSYLDSDQTKVTVWGSYVSEPLAYTGKKSIFIKNKVLLPRFRFTFQFGLKNIPSLFSEIRKSDVVHVHFARELTPVLASFITLLLKRKLVLQTHGMITKKDDLIYSLWDFLFTNPIFTRASIVLPLQEFEKRQLQHFPIKNFHIVPNGIDTAGLLEIELTREGVVFVSRIHERKRPEIFVESSKILLQQGYSGRIQIYGDDAGHLAKLKSVLIENNVPDWYVGGISHGQVLEVLSTSELLILPSFSEPFPMVVLESLSLGTPVLIMDDCGIADICSSLDPLFVSSSNPNQIAKQALEILAKYSGFQIRVELANRSREKFSIMRTVEGFRDSYAKLDLSCENA